MLLINLSTEIYECWRKIYDWKFVQLYFEKYYHHICVCKCSNVCANLTQSLMMELEQRIIKLLQQGLFPCKRHNLYNILCYSSLHWKKIRTQNSWYIKIYLKMNDKVRARSMVEKRNGKHTNRQKDKAILELQCLVNIVVNHLCEEFLPQATLKSRSGRW